jgi:hypothetical protein
LLFIFELLTSFSLILNQNVPEQVAKRNLVPPLRALQSARASSAAFALSAELRLARHCTQANETKYLINIDFYPSHKASVCQPNPAIILLLPNTCFFATAQLQFDKDRILI